MHGHRNLKQIDFVSALETDDKSSATNSSGVIAYSAGSLAMKLYAMQTYSPLS